FLQGHRYIHFLSATQDCERYLLASLEMIDLCHKVRDRGDLLSLETDKNIATHRIDAEPVLDLLSRRSNSRRCHRAAFRQTPDHITTRRRNSQLRQEPFRIALDREQF